MEVTAFECHAGSHDDSRLARLYVRYQVQGPPIARWLHFKVPGSKVGETSGQRIWGTDITDMTVDLDLDLFRDGYLLTASFREGPAAELIFEVGVQLGLDASGRPTATKVALPPSAD
jgi:hypothetical protein